MQCCTPEASDLTRYGETGGGPMYFTKAQYAIFRAAVEKQGAKPSTRGGLIGKEEALVKALKLTAKTKISRLARRPNRTPNPMSA